MEYYSSKEIAPLLGIHRSNVIKVFKKHGLKATYHGNVAKYTKSQIDFVIDKKNGVPLQLPEIIYIHTIYEIRESKINFQCL